ncbi:hypothetical protein EDC01DRAFT_54196 [Geopyxis carbonaria]|nr:hypothetical protein EDC01DRAFT_54196 [Geopyxis carbonaria]
MSTQGDKASLRRRFTTSIKRVMSIGSDKSRNSLVGEPSASPSSEPQQSPVRTAPVQSAAHVQKTTAKKASTPPPPMTPAERAQALFKKHGLDIKTSEWPIQAAPAGQRVEKDIRMRVHRTCHKCETTFGSDKTCSKCSHKRCKKCPRYPVKKNKGKGKEAGMEKLTANFYKKRKGDIGYGITMPSRKGGPDLVRKPIRQRVHRKCHRCQTDFASEKVCSKCDHTRCKKCPRNPSKNNKPPGYYDKFDPDDSDADEPFYHPPRRTYKRPRRRVHWTCSKCSTTFVEKTKQCAGCGSLKEDTGVRDPPKKEKKNYNLTDDELQRLNERMKQTSLTN